MEAIRFNLKDGKAFTDPFGVSHADAVMVPGHIINNLAAKRLEVVFVIYANPASVYVNQPLAIGFKVEINKDGRPNHTDEKGNIIEHGIPSYSEALQMFDITDDGIVVQTQEAVEWLVNASYVHKKPLTEFWEVA
ncbi:hypothetical protein [Phaeocystidibacter luteus]|uniref:Uncharacterized protein n=1 Tax=Phaeocystidibacter luteus TaxID=911197 RepID=A0A6N6RLT7_9FLAO|nr:hypothetical protein [Phaeocystidibacter luteus]KAB2814554.1 hypothetical protein F8C67_02105 [Phaeocystidibacter luteus]